MELAVLIVMIIIQMSIDDVGCGSSKHVMKSLVHGLGHGGYGGSQERVPSLRRWGAGLHFPIPGRRQVIPPGGAPPAGALPGGASPGGAPAGGSPPTDDTPPPFTIKPRTTPMLVTFKEECDYLAYYCIEGHRTGKLCAKTVYDNYYTFDSYCMMDYANCMERYETWHVMHMGACLEYYKPLEVYNHYEYNSDFFLDQIYTIQD